MKLIVPGTHSSDSFSIHIWLNVGLLSHAFSAFAFIWKLLRLVTERKKRLSDVDIHKWQWFPRYVNRLKTNAFVYLFAEYKTNISIQRKRNVLVTADLINGIMCFKLAFVAFFVAYCIGNRIEAVSEISSIPLFFDCTRISVVSNSNRVWPRNKWIK